MVDAHKDSICNSRSIVYEEFRSNSFLFAGGCCGNSAKKMVVGGWAWAWWLVTDVQRLSLEVGT